MRKKVTVLGDENGAELVYEQRIVKSVGASRGLVRERTELSVFQPIRRPPGPEKPKRTRAKKKP